MKVAVVIAAALSAVSGFVFVKEKQTYEDAQKHCLDIGSSLVSVHDSAENEALMNAVSSAGEINAWIGFSDSGAEGTWQWDDESAQDFLAWAPNQPDNNANRDATGEDCAVIFSQRGLTVWNDVPCSSKYSFFCAAVSEWVLVNDGTRRNYNEANEYCATEYGTHLATIKDAETQEAMRAEWLETASTQAWLGLKIDESVSNEWIWADGTVAGTGYGSSFTLAQGQYINWANGEPNRDNTQNCAELTSFSWAEGVVNDIPCSWTLAAMFCALNTDASATVFVSASSPVFIVSSPMIAALVMTLLALSAFVVRLFSKKKTGVLASENEVKYGTIQV